MSLLDKIKSMFTVNNSDKEMEYVEFKQKLTENEISDGLSEIMVAYMKEVSKEQGEDSIGEKTVKVLDKWEHLQRKSESELEEIYGENAEEIEKLAKELEEATGEDLKVLGEYVLVEGYSDEALKTEVVLSEYIWMTIMD